MKPYAHYHPDTNSMMITLVDPHGPTESEEVAEDIIFVYDEDNRVVAIEILNGVASLFGELLEAVKRGEPIGNNRGKSRVA